MGHLSQDLSQTMIKVLARASVISRTVSEGPLSVKHAQGKTQSLRLLN